MSGNRSLNAAARNKNDEFYTQLTDIEKELRHYRHHFKDRIVFCNCDDPYESNFFKYFVLNFNRLGLKKLMATCYVDSPIAGQQMSLFDLFTVSEQLASGETYKPYKAVVTKVYDTTGDGGVDMFDVAELFRIGENKLTLLQGDGDYRSDECLELLQEADIVVTNPPFSQFREYLSTLIEYDKSFIILGNQNAVTYKEVFPLLMENKVWLGYHSGDMAFMVPDSYEPRATRYWQDETGQKWRSLGNICWFTNLDIRKRHEELILVKRYNPVDYPKYDNYDAINVDRVADIPCDYFENMAVPITYMDKYNPDQFDIVDANQIRTNDGTPFKEHGLIKDKDAVISTKKDLTSNPELASSLTDRQTDRQTDGLPMSELSSDGRCNGIMGVPITFLNYYNPEQFELIGATESEGKGFSNGLWDDGSGVAQPVVTGKRKYKRLFIKRKM